MSVPDASPEVARRLAAPAPAARRRGRLFALLAGLLLAAVAAEIWRKGVLLRPDSRSYMWAAIHRTAAYPALIELVRRLVGPALLPTLVAVQSALGLASATVLALHLRRRFALGVPSALTVLAVLLSPYWVLWAGNLVLAQALAYPLFLLALRFLIAGTLDGRDRDLALYFVLAAFTLLARPQFLFLHAVSLVVIVAVASSRRGWRRNLPLVALFAASLLIAPLADRTWRWWRHGTFAGLPYAGHQLIAGALYVSDAEDAALFSGPTRELYEAMHGAAVSQRLVARDDNRPPWRPLPGLGLPLYRIEHFRFVYNKLAWQEAFNLASQKFCPGCPPAAAFLAIDPPLREIAFGILRAHPGRWLLLYLSNLLATTGPTEWLLIGLLFAAAAARVRRGPDPAARALLLATVVHVANLGLVAVVEPELDRYTFPTAVAWLALAVVFLRSVAVGPPSAPPEP